MLIPALAALAFISRSSVSVKFTDTFRSRLSLDSFFGRPRSFTPGASGLYFLIVKLGMVTAGNRERPAGDARCFGMVIFYLPKHTLASPTNPLT